MRYLGDAHPGTTYESNTLHPKPKGSVVLTVLLGAATDSALLAAESSDDSVATVMEDLLTHPVVLGLASLGLIGLAVITIFMTLRQRFRTHGVEQTVRSIVGGEPVLEVTTKSENKEDFVSTPNGVQVIQAHYEELIKNQSEIIKDQGDIIQEYRTERHEEREENRRKFDEFDRRLGSLQSALDAKEKIIAAKNDEITDLKETIRLLREDRTQARKIRNENLARITELESQVEVLRQEIARLKSTTH